MLELIFHDLEKHLNLKPLKVENQVLGNYLLEIGDKFEVYIRELQPGIVFKSMIINFLLPGDKEALFSYLMKANFIGQGTGSAVIGMDPEEKFLTLTLIIPYEINYRTFCDKLENFLNYLEFWQNELNRLETRQI